MPPKATAARSAAHAPALSVVSSAPPEAATVPMLGQQLREMLPPRRLHSVSICDHEANVLWLSEGQLGPDENSLVVEALEVLGADTNLPCHEAALEDSHYALFLPVRTPHGAVVGLAMVLADSKSVGDDTLERVTAAPVRTLLQRLAVLLKPDDASAPPEAGNGTASVPVLELEPEPVEVLPAPPAARAGAAASKPAPSPRSPAHAGAPDSAVRSMPVLDLEPDPAEVPPASSAPARAAAPPAGATLRADSVIAPEDVMDILELELLPEGLPAPPVLRPAEPQPSMTPAELVTLEFLSGPPSASGPAARGLKPAPAPATASAARAQPAAASKPRAAAPEVAPPPAPMPAPAPAPRAASAPASHGGAPATSRRAPAAKPVAASEPPATPTPPAAAAPPAPSLPGPPSVAPVAETASEKPVPAAALMATPVNDANLILEVLPFGKLRSGGDTRRFQILPRVSSAQRDPAALDALVLQRLLGWLAAHRAAWNSQPTSFTVGLSIATLEDERFATKIAAALNSHGIAPEMFGFEITEALCTQRRAQVERFVNQCEKFGSWVVIDDFSFDSQVLPLLRSKAVRLVKINPKLSSAALKDKLSQALVVASVQAAKVLGVHVAAQKVDSRAALQWLSAIGCDFAQGEALSPPQPLEALSNATEPTIITALRSR